MKKVTVYVTLREAVLDPQGKAIQESLHSLGYEEIRDVRVGKRLDILVEDKEDLEQRIIEMCEKLLANPVIEDYRYEVEEVVHS
ncbi:phosphoribosylformylglycinamidine synthase subunit PurS [Lederbergia sp. NSJ-179]|uniref:phosphoribosylformylglycinamidine synthase subunit PurS n=1 Tax=Lederbergia sp. NSJ-179 TaxID=2931402 RepID=UPI001FD56E97|nr:phosphoribosylformylglycinamidine synthase subunit PurS [Lederbergia sp. NSJ-179]MCJ7841000.1 phosphoribosylformylglycinamidine synthase subunit PurS [Lederbergia sp. NSJ-179]